MRFIYVLVLIFLCACEKSQRVEFKEPNFFFSWDPVKKEGSCTNKKGQTGYNPKFVGPCGDLRGYSFTDYKLDGIDFSGAILDGMNLSGFSLNGANFSAALARGTNFNEAEMNGVKFMYGHFEGSKFEKAELNGADFEGASLSGSTLIESSLRGANYASSDLSGVKLPKKLHRTKLENSIYSYGTKMPFSDQIAEGRGMKASEKRFAEVTKKQSKEAKEPKEPKELKEPEDITRLPAKESSEVLEDKNDLKNTNKKVNAEKVN